MKCRKKEVKGNDMVRTVHSVHDLHGSLALEKCSVISGTDVPTEVTAAITSSRCRMVVQGHGTNLNEALCDAFSAIASGFEIIRYKTNLRHRGSGPVVHVNVVIAKNGRSYAKTAEHPHDIVAVAMVMLAAIAALRAYELSVESQAA